MNPSSTTKNGSSDRFQPTKAHCVEPILSREKNNKYDQIKEMCRVMVQKQGVHSINAMRAAGFHYTDNRDTTRCDICQLEVSQWTLDMHPFTIHAQRSPKCSYVRSVLPDGIIPLAVSLGPTPSGVDEMSFRHQKIELIQQNSQPNALVEVNKMKEIRRRTFSHWRHRTSPSDAQMIEAGFFSCNVGDRVICLYCNLICQQWLPNIDNPWEAHKTLSPKCPYVVTMLKCQQTSSIRTVDEYSTSDHSLASNTINSFRCNEIDYTAAYHIAYTEISRRHASFATWPNENSSSVDNLVRAGFFTPNWGTNDNPMVEHARWFPNCTYVKELYAAALNRTIEGSQRAQQEHAEFYNEELLSYLVKARLDLPISKSLVAQGFDSSIIESCYENQLKLTHDDFVDDADLRMACIIRQKQIEYIDGRKEKIIIPSVAMTKSNVKISSSLQNDRSEMNTQHQENESALTDRCPVCGIAMTDMSDVPCGHALQLRSTRPSNIEGFVCKNI